MSSSRSVDSKSPQMSGIDAMETYNLRIPEVGLGLRIGSMVRVRVKVRVG